MQPEQVTRMRFRRAPMAAAALWFALGIGAEHWISPAPRPLATALLVLVALAAFLIQRDARGSWLPVAAVWAFAGLAAAHWEPRPPTTTPLMAYADGLSRTVRGHIIRIHPLSAQNTQQDQDIADFGELAEEPLEGAEHALSVDVAVDAVEYLTPDISRMIAISGGLRATVYGDTLPKLNCGDAVELALRLKLPERYLDPGAFQYADQLLAEGISTRGSLRADRLHIAGPGWDSARGWEEAHCRIQALQSWAAARLDHLAAAHANRLLPALLRLDANDAAMLDAMLFGERSGLHHALRSGFERTGSFHLFVVSGLHVALLAAGVFWALRRLRLRPWVATAVTLALATAYAVLTGFGQPVQRALAMTSLYLIARLMSRQSDSLNSLGTAILGMLIWSPASLFTASFQMTALAVVAIAGIAGPLGERSFLPYLHGLGGPDRRLPPRVQQLRLMVELWGEWLARLLGRWALPAPRLLIRALLWTLELALIGVVAELVMALPMALYFHRAAVFAVPANMLVIPLIAVLAPLAVLTFAASLASPWLALPPAAATALLLHAVRWGIGRLSHLAAADVRVPGPVWWIGVLAVAAWLACAWAVRRGRWGAWAAVAALPLIASCVLWPEPVVRAPGMLEVSALDVGQGDSLLVVAPDGRSMLVDAGGPVGAYAAQSAIQTSFDIGEEVVSPYLWSRRMRRLDVVALTHAHSDHMGGMPAVLRSFRPRELWVGIDPGSTGYAALLQEARDLGIAVRHLHAGDAQNWGEVKIAVLSPASAYSNTGAPKNDDSLVMRLQFGAASVLLEGDAERRSEQAMVAVGIAPVTLLKVGHHGSLTSTTAAFLAAAAPRDAVISVGRANTFGHPRAEVVDRLAASGATLYRTDQSGLTTFLLGRDGGIQAKIVGAGGSSAACPAAGC
ncbi:competence protein ComEC [Granulicella rosea]|uniref:Competence protein ComEC n=1 Tax=Granulicella rosea TaxID=474952 RepID=A0A239KSM5_9BACT|nr:ComEC/Rec2 family competence protein [Granulicella rosea]SNT21055.1 competence protein ComEC [Granulicella rosea]